MFGFFKKDEPQVKVSDKVWISEGAKWDACAKMAQANQDVVFVCWFQKTSEKLAAFMLERAINSTIMLASDLSEISHGKLLIFAEHYPLSDTEQQLFLKLGLAEAHVLCALDEPLFQQFKGERIVGLMKSMGMESDEIVGHPMVSKAIRNAQKKIAERIKVEIKASSPEEWFEANLDPK